MVVTFVLNWKPKTDAEDLEFYQWLVNILIHLCDRSVNLSNECHFKPVFGVSNKTIFKPVYSAEILPIGSQDIVSKNEILA